MLEEKKMKRTIKDFDLEGKKIIIRCDLNVPIENGVITDSIGMFDFEDTNIL